MKGSPSSVLYSKGSQYEYTPMKSSGCGCLAQKGLTMFDARADMVPHGEDLDIASTVGAFYRGQEARFHCHSDFSR